MERFVRLVVAGGATLVAGLWILALTETWSAPWLLGAGLTALGATSILAGTVSEVRGLPFGE